MVLYLLPTQTYKTRQFTEKEKLNVLTNTDTKGLFAANLYEEYSIMAVVDMKTTITSLMKELASNSKKHLFDTIEVF